MLDILKRKDKKEGQENSELQDVKRDKSTDKLLKKKKILLLQELQTMVMDTELM